MTTLSADLDQVARWAVRAPMPPSEWNPVYRALLGDAADPDPAPSSAPAADPPSAAELDMLLRQLTAPALLVLAVTTAESTERLRIALAPEGATVETSRGQEPSRWDECALSTVPRRLTDLLAGTGLGSAPAALGTDREIPPLRLSPDQQRAAQERLLAGVPAAEALAGLPDLDPRLRDALTAEELRVSVSLTLHDPRGRATERPVTWSRLWVRGDRGLYRTDGVAAGPPEVRPVGDGDVLGTLLPLLEEGLRFALVTRAGAA